MSIRTAGCCCCGMLYSCIGVDATPREIEVEFEDPLPTCSYVLDTHILTNFLDVGSTTVCRFRWGMELATGVDLVLDMYYHNVNHEYGLLLRTCTLSGTFALAAGPFVWGASCGTFGFTGMTCPARTFTIQQFCQGEQIQLGCRSEIHPNPCIHATDTIVRVRLLP